MRGWLRGLFPVPAEAGATSRVKGQRAEHQAQAYLQAQGLRLLARNYKTPGRGGGEIDLIMEAPDGTVVFVEVRSRSRADFGGAGASISAAKRQRIVLAAQHWLLAQGGSRACRFDVMLQDGPAWQWLPAAFDTSP